MTTLKPPTITTGPIPSDWKPCTQFQGVHERCDRCFCARADHPTKPRYFKIGHGFRDDITERELLGYIFFFVGVVVVIGLTVIAQGGF